MTEYYQKSKKSDCVLIIPIYHPDRKWNECLRMLKKQKDVHFDVYIVDSGSDMKTYKKDLAGLSYEMVKTTPDQFNHGRTRQEAAEACADYPFLVYMTQDAIPADEYTIRNLLDAFDDPKVGCAYGRQLPHKDATVLAARARAFNYPSESRVKKLRMHRSSGSKFRLFQILLRPIVQKRCGRLAASLQMSYWGKITMWRRRWYLPAGTTRIVRKRRCIILTITRFCRSSGGILIPELSMPWNRGFGVPSDRRKGKAFVSSWQN